MAALLPFAFCTCTAVKVPAGTVMDSAPSITFQANGLDVLAVVLPVDFTSVTDSVYDSV